jgi:hypothetical protein
MADNISSNVLFHFTSSMDHLKSILENGIQPRYCLEYSLDKDDRRSAHQNRPPLRAIPMVCFCDLPLSLIRKHLKEYGRFGIGLDKTWGTRNGVSPVIYTHGRSKTRPSLSRLTSIASPATEKVSRDLNYLAAYTKPFQGPAWRKGRAKHRIRFYDEREWRYVPAIQGKHPLFLDRSDFDDEAMRRTLHTHLKKEHALSITPHAVQYLIIPYDKSEKGVLELHDFVMRLYTKRYSRKDAVLVATAIMTDDCIKHDI